MFSKQDVADYYDQTQHHYENWWRLRDNLSLHYGIWESDTKTFDEALENTNRILFEQAGIKEGETILDAGCGVGGAAFYIAHRANTMVHGISLSAKQIALADESAQKLGLQNNVTFHQGDFTQTGFADETVDVVWACESVCHAADKQAFTDEAFRILKPGGRLVLFDFFKTADHQNDPKQFMNKWKQTWGVPDFASFSSFTTHLQESGFTNISVQDFTAKVTPSAKRLYHAALWGAIPAEFYNLFHPKVQRWTKTHYQCGYFQYKALRENLWQYGLFSAIKM